MYKLLRILSIFFICGTLSSIAIAEAQLNQSMKKDLWLKRIRSIVPEPICKGFFEDQTIVKRLKKLNIEYETCIKQIPPIALQCQKQFYDEIPSELDEKVASIWGRKIGECIGTEYARTKLYSEKGQVLDTSTTKK